MIVGCVVGHDAALDAETNARDVAAVLDEEPYLPAAIVDLCRWVADYYMAGYGDAIAAAMPPGSRRDDASKTQRIVAVTAHGLSLVSRLKPAPTTEAEDVGAGFSRLEGGAVADVGAGFSRLEGDAVADVGAGFSRLGGKLTAKQI